MSPEEIKEMQDAISQYSLSDVVGGRLLAMLLVHLTNLSDRVGKLEGTRRKVAQAEQGGENAN